MFQIGDKVRLKGDHLDSHWIVVGIYREMNEVGILFFDQKGTITQLVNPSQISLVDQNADLKQAIREVLLSEEFLAAFAKAWQSTIRNQELNLIVADDTRPYKSWNEIASECPPVTINMDSLTITGSESEAYYLNKLKNGETK